MLLRHQFYVYQGCTSRHANTTHYTHIKQENSHVQYLQRWKFPVCSQLQTDAQLASGAFFANVPGIGFIPQVWAQWVLSFYSFHWNTCSIMDIWWVPFSALGNRKGCLSRPIYCIPKAAMNYELVKEWKEGDLVSITLGKAPILLMFLAFFLLQ